MTNRYPSGSLKWLSSLISFGKVLVNVLLSAMAILIFLFIVIAVFLFYHSPAYYKVLNHDQQYYLDLAISCNDVLLQKGTSSKVVTIKGDDPSLPKLLLDLHATKLVIDKDVPLTGSTYEITDMEIVFGEYRPDYVIWWRHSDYGNGHRPWELSVSDGGGNGQILYSTDPNNIGK